MNRFISSILLIIVCYSNVTCQEFSNEEQYKQALSNAKLAFDAKQYSQAVVFYREAQKIKPQSLLPKYKIEDIHTIYIEKELKLQPQKETVVSKKEARKKKAFTGNEVNPNDDVIRESATRKMNEEADLIQNELQNLKVASLTIVEDPVEIDTSGLLVLVIEKDRETAVQPLEMKNNKQLTINKGGSSGTTTELEKREQPEIQKNNQAKVTKTEAREPLKGSKPAQTDQPVKKEKHLISEEERQQWIEQEKKRLVIAYPNRKTVEEIEQPGKHITRVIMNINQQVIIYLKVQHTWGAVFFFTDEIGQELKSINEQYFNLMTNLDTYGN